MRRTSATGITFIILLWAVGTSAQADISALANIVQTGSVEQKRDALFALRDLRSESASNAARPALADSAEIIRATAAGAVVFLSPPEAVAALLLLLDDRAVFVRREAAYALGEVGDQRSSGSLGNVALNNKDPEMRTAAVIALGKIGDPGSIGVYISILNRRPAEETQMLRRSAARGIAQTFRRITIGSTVAVNPQNFLPDTFKSSGDNRMPAGMISEAILASSRSVLIQVLKDRREADDTRREAIFALGESRDPSVADMIRSFRGSPDPYLAETAKEALLKISASVNLPAEPGSK